MKVTEQMAVAAAKSWYGKAWGMLGPADRKKVSDDMQIAVSCAIAAAPIAIIQGERRNPGLVDELVEAFGEEPSKE